MVFVVWSMNFVNVSLISNKLFHGNRFFILFSSFQRPVYIVFVLETCIHVYITLTNIACLYYTLLQCCSEDWTWYFSPIIYLWVTTCPYYENLNIFINGQNVNIFCKQYLDFVHLFVFNFRVERICV